MERPGLRSSSTKAQTTEERRKLLYEGGLPSHPPFNNDGAGPIRVLGYPHGNIAAGFARRVKMFESSREGAIRGALHPTAREQAMVQLMEDLTDLDGWLEDVFDDFIVQDWRTTIAVAEPLINEAAWQWCVAELRDKAKTYQSTSHLITLNINACVCKSDIVASRELCEELSRQIATCGCRTDSHDSCVSHSIDPALFPLIFGRTSILCEGGRVMMDNVTGLTGRGQTIHAWNSCKERPDNGKYEMRYISMKSQWLPFEVEFQSEAQDSKAARITSYINNVHPVHQRSVYEAVEKLLPGVVGMWNEVLMKADRHRYPRRIKIRGTHWTHGSWRDFSWIKDPDLLHDPATLEEATQFVQEYLSQPESSSRSLPEAGHGLIIEPADFPEALYQKWLRLRTWQYPDPGVSFSYEQWKQGETKQSLDGGVHPQSWWAKRYRNHEYYTLHIEELFRTQGVQVIAKASSINLCTGDTSKDHEFRSDPRAMDEGIMNERIVASARLYYSVDNVSGARMFFEQDVEHTEEDAYPEEFLDFHGTIPFQHTYNVWGDASDLIGEFDELPVTLGSVALRTGRLVAWPNFVRTRIDQFSLLDVNRPGHVRWLTLYLVDPQYRIVSTRNVPPQQADWWIDDAMAAADLSSRGLPAELINQIAEYLYDWPMSLEEALAHKEDMDNERKKYS